MSDLREQEERTADRRPADKLIEISHEIASCWLLTEAAQIAAGGLQPHERGPMTEKLDSVSTRLRAIGSDLQSV